MSHSNPEITIQEVSPELGDTLETRLLADLRATQPQAVNTSFVLAAQGPEDTVDSPLLIGGLTASTSYGWLLVKVLWVNEKFRGKGVASALMNEAETRAIQLDCHAAWLDTSSQSARVFYQRLGYTEFASLGNDAHNHPAEHQRWFMQKQLQNNDRDA